MSQLLEDLKVVRDFLTPDTWNDRFKRRFPEVVKVIDIAVEKARLQDQMAES